MTGKVHLKAVGFNALRIQYSISMHVKPDGDEALGAGMSGQYYRGTKSTWHCRNATLWIQS